MSGGYRDSIETARARLAEIEKDLGDRRAEALLLSQRLDAALETIPETPVELETRTRKRLFAGAIVGLVVAIAFILAAGGIRKDQNLIFGLVIGALVTAISGIDVGEVMKRRKRTRAELGRVLADTKEEAIAGVDLATTKERIATLDTECSELEREAVLCRSLLAHAERPVDGEEDVAERTAVEAKR